MAHTTKDIILAGVMGLNLSDVNHAVFVAESTKGIEDMNEFIQFCRDKKESIEYSTKTEKLDTLSTMYKKLQHQKSLPHETAKTFTHQIVEKVEAVRIHIKNKIAEGDDRKQFTDYMKVDMPFNAKEISALNGLNKRPTHIISMSESKTLEGALYDFFMVAFVRNKNTKVLTDNQKRIHSMVTVTHSNTPPNNQTQTA